LPLQEPWQEVLGGMQRRGPAAGRQAVPVVAHRVEQSHAAWRHGRAASLRATQSMMGSCSALVSGVLRGLSEALLQEGVPPKLAGRRRTRG